MLSNNLCRKDIPGLGEALPISDYAAIESVSEEEVLDLVTSRRLHGIKHGGNWFVEAPPFCEERLLRLHLDKRKQQQQPKQEQSQQKQSRSERQATATPPKTPYQILGVKPDASPEEIKLAYRKRIQEYHPDKVSHLGPELRELAERKSKELNQAYGSLSR
jgi:hypothetical protein